MIIAVGIVCFVMGMIVAFILIDPPWRTNDVDELLRKNRKYK